ncbi:MULTISPECIES: glutamate racemase [Holospora]|uniref:Glutamate racemase n=2 Tax=Holospora TaxID=44747 RepID=A0A061JHL2_9PROT|nr:MULTISPECIES: aspartate/glutamate racemase family protein [Holospora]ETZ04927.1 glutamate racemase [Holospora undulata HU1]GAJ46320.1 glutamate racemase [Holospora elegans E1]
MSFSSCLILGELQDKLQDVLDYPIGIYDSGLGGIKVLLDLYRAMPDRRFVYFADLHHMPYGERSSDSVVQLSQNNVKFLEKQGCILIVAACHTSTTCLKANNIVPSNYFISMAESLYAVIQEAVSEQCISEVTVLTTQRTLDSGVYQAHLLQKMPRLTLHVVACPSWVLAIESQDEDEKYKAVKEILPYIYNTSAIVYGCTHFSEMDAVLKACLPSKCLRLDPSSALCGALKRKGGRKPKNLIDSNQIRVITNGALAPQLEHFIKHFSGKCSGVEYISPTKLWKSVNFFDVS